MGARLVAAVEPDRNYGHAGVTTKKQRFTYFQKVYGHGRWRKLKGITFVKLPQKHFVLCVDNTGYEASLIARKMYEVVPDQQAEQDDFIRVIDESGEDYLYHTSHFVFIELPVEIERVLEAA